MNSERHTFPRALFSGARFLRAWGRIAGRAATYPPVLFCLLLSWLYFSSPWYPATTLLASGTTTDIETTLHIWFDSGRGLNGYEREKFNFQPLPAYRGEDGLPLVITRTGTRNGASIGKKVVLRSIHVDGRPLDIAGRSLPKGIEEQDGRLVFTKDGSSLQLTIRPQASLRLEFPKFNEAGEVDVRFGQQTSRLDLYSPNNETQWGGRHAAIMQSWFVTEQGTFSISMSLPRYQINALRVAPSDSFSLASTVMKTEDGQEFSLSGGEYKGSYIFTLRGIDEQRQRLFHPDRFLFQLICAALSTLLLTLLFRFARRFNGVKDIFINERRYLFWLMLAGASTVFAFWHLAFWPGVTSNDSLEIWRAAQIPGTYLGDHPPLNVIFYIFLSLFWNHVAVVPLFQNLCTALLTAYILFSLFRRGLPLGWLAVCYLIVIASIPVGLYTIVLWKDVPYALISVLLGFELARLYDDKRSGRLPVTWRKWLYLSCLTVVLIGFRHNGILYLLIVPTILLLFGIVSIRLRTVAILGGGVVLFGLVFFLYPGNSATSGYLVSQTKRYLGQAMAGPVTEQVVDSSKKYLGIFDVNQQNMQWDLLHLCMYGRYENDFLRSLRWNDVYAYQAMPKGSVIDTMREAAWAVYWQSYQVPWVYLSWNPLYMLLILPILPLLYRVLPMSALFSLYILIPVAALVFLNILNWRYYYFAYLGLCFVLPVVITDMSARKRSS